MSGEQYGEECGKERGERFVQSQAEIEKLEIHSDPTYREGFEDAIELCIAETEDASNKATALDKMKDLLVLVKEDKFDRLKKMWGQLLK